MKRSLFVSAFLLALLGSGCSQPVAPAPAAQAQPDDPHRDDRDRDKDRERREAEDRDHPRPAPCPAGQHLFTDRDGRASCVNN
jgi:hypothetical protein